MIIPLIGSIAVILIAPQVTVWFGVFLFLSYYYSAPPLRFKIRPYIDSLSNVLYLIPGIIGYELAGGHTLDWMIVVGAALWCVAMHAYSAVPDISSDKRAGIVTIAVILGGKRTILLCLFCYLSAILCTFSLLGFISLLLGGIYGAVMLMSYVYLDSKNNLTVYKFFPIVNSLSGFILFLFLMLKRQ